MRALVLALVLTACARTGEPPDPARELQTHLMAPCCWRQTLADHESPLATELRTEISARLRAGDAPAVIEADLVDRYGVRMRALAGSTGDPRLLIGGLTAIAVALGLGALVLLLRRGRVSLPLRPAPPEPDELSDRLDDELARFAD